MLRETFLVLLKFFLVALTLYALGHVFSCACIRYRNRASNENASRGEDEKDPSDEDSESYPRVDPRYDFDWSTTKPLKLRPFKPTYHLTMGLTNVDVSCLIEMDQNYLERITLRRKLMQDHEKSVLAAHSNVKPAVDEFYIWLLGTYLPTRYPRMFSLSQEPKGSLSKIYGSGTNKARVEESYADSNVFTHLKSHVTEEYYSLSPPDSPLNTLKAIGGIIDDDCQFLLPSDDGETYTLRGLVTCFPNGFDMSRKLGLKLRDIHEPVPHYKEKLEKSMDRFFAKLPVGRFVRRVNWTVSRTPTLFNPAGNHIYEGDDIPDDTTVDPSKAILRSELQMLHRLPRTKALLFTFKTYAYPLQEIKDEGLGNELAKAIDGMRDGSAPGIHRYKGAVVWGEKTKAFLKS